MNPHLKTYPYVNETIRTYEELIFKKSSEFCHKTLEMIHISFRKMKANCGNLGKYEVFDL